MEEETDLTAELATRGRPEVRSQRQLRGEDERAGGPRETTSAGLGRWKGHGVAALPSEAPHP